MSAEMTNNAGDIINAVNAARKRALEMIGQTAEGYAKLNCAVDTGRLRASISHAVQDETVYIGTNVEYAPYVEFGTGMHASMGGGTLVTFDKEGNAHPFSGMVARPYLKPAIADHIGEWELMIEACLK